jgi:hypothetical protein
MINAVSLTDRLNSIDNSWQRDQYGLDTWMSSSPGVRCLGLNSKDHREYFICPLQFCGLGAVCELSLSLT